MWWNDIKDIKLMLCNLTQKMFKIQSDIQLLNEKSDMLSHEIDDIRLFLREGFDFTEENNTFNRIHDKLNFLMNDDKRVEKVLLAQKTLDKFDDYMKNVDKLNSMINEFKGYVAMARACVPKRNDNAT